MIGTTLAIHDQLNDFLPPSRRDIVIILKINGSPSVKNLIESRGIPHPEIGQILVNNRPVEFSYKVNPGDSIEVFPASPQLDLLSGLFTKGKFTFQPRFVLDNHLGKLTTYLRMLGFDALYRNDIQDNELANIASNSKRILLTRDRQLLMRKTINYGYWLRSLDPEIQVREVIQRFGLKEYITPFRRCLQCNASLMPVSKEAIINRLEPLTKKYFDEFQICPECNQIYWKGSHYERMLRLIDRLMI